MTKKVELIYDTIFDIYKILLGALLTLSIAIFVKLLFEPSTYDICIKALSIVFVGLLLSSLLFGLVFVWTYKNIKL